MPKVLLVDDDPLRAFQRKAILERRFDVKRVAEAVDAFCLLDQPLFVMNLGLVICAHHMRALGGPEFVAELQNRMPDMPILVLGGPSHAESEYAGNLVHFLGGPVGSEELLTAAGQMLVQHELLKIA